jgi:hypothetical protein|tara:strand:+ start:476 stop:922 length:447 start_codon:yes stop_codon:yes gene_type:complete
MPDHIRQTIREAVVTAVTGLTTTGSNVYDSRVVPVETQTLPCLLVYASSETVEVETLGSARSLLRELEVVVEGVAKATSSIEDTLDLIGKEVEVAIGGGPTLSGACDDIHLTGVELLLSGESETPHGTVKMTFAAFYSTPENDPTTSR